MKEKMINNVEINGYIFDHTLKLRTSKKDIEYISGIVNVGTDEEMLNIVPVHFIYVTETFNSGKPNPNYEILKKIIETDNVYSVNGREADRVRISGNIGVNDFVNNDGEMISSKRAVGSWIHFADGRIDGKATFEADMVISAAIEHEVESGNDYVSLKGYTFNFRNDLVPVEFSISNKAGMDYFIDQDISNSNPLCTKVWGNIISNVITKEETIESAFGAPKVEVTSRTLRAWEIEGASTEPYTWDDESFITKSELKSKLDAREEALAEVRKRNEEYQNSKKGKNSFPTTEKAVESKSVADDDFPF